MATPTPSEKLWKVAPTRCLPNQSILTCFATKSTAGWQAPRDRQLPCDVRLGSKPEVSALPRNFRFTPQSRHQQSPLRSTCSSLSATKEWDHGKSRNCDRNCDQARALEQG